MKRLLIVDDEPAIARLLERVAQEFGFQTSATGCPGEFLKQVGNGGADAIILDLSLPGTDGVELLRGLANAHCSARILIISGFDARVLETSSSYARARGLSVTGTLTKPIRLAALREAVKMLAVSPCESGRDRTDYAADVADGRQ